MADRQQHGHHVIAVDFSEFPTTALNEGGVHLTSEGYSLMGDWWYDFIHQIPKDWIEASTGPELNRPNCSNSADNGASGGPDPNTQPSNYSPPAIKQSNPRAVSSAADAAGTGGLSNSEDETRWYPSDRITRGDRQYKRNRVQAGKLADADGVKLGSGPVHLADTNNDDPVLASLLMLTKSLRVILRSMTAQDQ